MCVCVCVCFNYLGLVATHVGMALQYVGLQVATDVTKHFWEVGVHGTIRYSVQGTGEVKTAVCTQSSSILHALFRTITK